MKSRRKCEKKTFRKRTKKQLCVALKGHRREANGLPNSTFQQILRQLFPLAICRGYMWNEIIWK